MAAPEDARDRRSAAERVIAAPERGEEGHGKPLSERSRTRTRSLEAHFRADQLPRYIRRLRDIEKATREHERRLAREHAELAEACAGDPDRFAREWRARTARWDFGVVNDLIGQHNDWYPIERDLPMDPRTRDYVLVSGRSYRRTPLDAAWALERFPADRRPPV